MCLFICKRLKIFLIRACVKHSSLLLRFRIAVRICIFRYGTFKRGKNPDYLLSKRNAYLVRVDCTLFARIEALEHPSMVVSSRRLRAGR